MREREVTDGQWDVTDAAHAGGRWRAVSTKGSGGGGRRGIRCTTRAGELVRKGPKGYSALSDAVKHNHARAIELMLSKLSARQIVARDMTGYIPLHFAAIHSDAALELIIKRVPSDSLLTVSMKYGATSLTPMQMAAQAGRGETVRIIGRAESRAYYTPAPVLLDVISENIGLLHSRLPRRRRRRCGL